MRITAAGTVIDGKSITGDLEIAAQNVTVKNSQINGTVTVVDDGSGSLTLSDSIVDVGAQQAKAVVGVNLSVVRSELRGGISGGVCSQCLIQDSWIHGQVIPSNVDWHASGYRADQGTTLRHNTISCDAADTATGGGCSADLTMYGDWAPVQNIVVDNNLFVASSKGLSFCSYGGSSGGKPYSNNANNIVFTNNVFQRGTNGKCGRYGAVSDFIPSLPGNKWVGNVWDDGSPV